MLVKALCGGRLVELVLLVLHHLEQAAARFNAGRVEAFRQTQYRRLKDRCADMLVRPALMIETIRTGTVARAIVGCLDEPGIMTLAKLTGKLSGNNSARMMDIVERHHCR